MVHWSCIWGMVGVQLILVMSAQALFEEGSFFLMSIPHYYCVSVLGSRNEEGEYPHAADSKVSLKNSFQIYVHNQRRRNLRDIPVVA